MNSSGIREMSPHTPTYIYEMKYSKRRELNQILDVSEGWKRLGKCDRLLVKCVRGVCI